MKIYVAMSGGVDSSVAAALLNEQGHDVTGVTMQLLDKASDESAKQAAAKVGIPHMTVDFRDRFKSCVVNKYIYTYETGTTPNPCVVCNDEVKFGALLDYALENGADKLATGHYARVQGMKLLKGIDPKKDQSYFLYRLTQNRLRHILLPLGEMTKGEVRAKARELGLPQADLEESQDVCFSVDMVSEPGEIIGTKGNVIGTHKGITGVTIGQRKGLGVAAAQPLYVLAIDAPRNRIIAGPREEGFKSTIEIEGVSWIQGSPPAADFTTEARIRYNSPDAQASVKITGGDTAKIDFHEPQFAPAPGQSVVFYDGDELLGGGIISKI